MHGTTAAGQADQYWPRISPEQQRVSRQCGRTVGYDGPIALVDAAVAADLEALDCENNRV